MSAKSLRIPRHWSFKRRDVAAAFDRHVRQQLPWYDLATGIVAHIGRHMIPSGGLVYDLGASTGNVGRSLGATLAQRGANLIAVDDSPQIARRYSGPGRMVVADVRKMEFEACDLIVAFLMLMFLPPADRGPLLRRMKAAVRPGGGIVVFDKRLPAAGSCGLISSRLTLAAKYEAGARPEEIIGKELSLAGVQRPVMDGELTGFSEIFRFGEFSGWIWPNEV